MLQLVPYIHPLFEFLTRKQILGRKLLAGTSHSSANPTPLYPSRCALWKGDGGLFSPPPAPDRPMLPGPSICNLHRGGAHPRPHCGAAHPFGSLPPLLRAFLGSRKRCRQRVPGNVSRCRDSRGGCGRPPAHRPPAAEPAACAVLQVGHHGSTWSPAVTSAGVLSLLRSLVANGVAHCEVCSASEHVQTFTSALGNQLGRSRNSYSWAGSDPPFPPPYPFGKGLER